MPSVRVLSPAGVVQQDLARSVRRSLLVESLQLFLLVSCHFHCRAPEPQKPHTKPLDDMVRSNHYDPDEDEEYYRKQLSYFDRRSFDSKAMGQPGPGINRFHDLPKPAQLSYPYNRYHSQQLDSLFGGGGIDSPPDFNEGNTDETVSVLSFLVEPAAGWL